jgi:hypothetical protein
MEFEELKGDEAIRFILKILREAGKPLTTREVQKIVDGHRLRCPDSTILFLSRLKNKGIIEGVHSEEKRGWVWWIEHQVQETTL